MLVKVAFRGVPFENGIDENNEDKVIIIPPLPLNKVRQYTQEVVEIDDPDETKKGNLKNERVKEIILEAIHRNYPDFTKDELEEFVTLRNLYNAYQAAIGSNSTTDGKLFPDLVRSAGELTPESQPL